MSLSLSFTRPEQPEPETQTSVVSEFDSQQSGESRARCEQLEYLLDGVESERSGPATRRTSARELAEAVASPRGRFFARSRGLVPRMFALLEVAAAAPGTAASAGGASRIDEALALPVATIAFFLSQENASLEVSARRARKQTSAAQSHLRALGLRSI